jgi:hypothetical protein
VGAVLVVAGLVLVFVPTLVQDPGPAADTFEAIERRVRWGALVGIGALLIARTQLRPWGITIASFVLWIDLGYLVARCIGLALEGTDSDRQWMWLGIEVVIAVAAGAYLWGKRARPTRPPHDVPDASA